MKPKQLLHSQSFFFAIVMITSVHGGSTNNFQRLQKKLSPSPGDILDTLDTYSKFWIELKSSPCVWSECGIDDTDDAYMGDNRDGDEQWYQYRTQNFCANAAYSLYGRKKGDLLLGSRCSKRHYINSYFTYGGADNMLKAIGKSPIVYYDGGNGYYATSNADCVDVSNNNDGDDNKNNRRELGSGSNDNNDGYSSSLACDSEGNYNIGLFEGGSCDGNYFQDVIDTFTNYNKQHANVGCHALEIQSEDNEDDDSSTTNTALYQLLSNSWTCDIQLYPINCPDPYGEKIKYEYALRTASHGGNPMLAYKNMQLKRPLRAISFILVILSMFIYYYTKKYERFKTTEGKGGDGVKGCLNFAMGDILKRTNGLFYNKKEKNDTVNPNTVAGGSNDKGNGDISGCIDDKSNVVMHEEENDGNGIGFEMSESPSRSPRRSYMMNKLKTKILPRSPRQSAGEGKEVML